LLALAMLACAARAEAFLYCAGFTCRVHHGRRQRKIAAGEATTLLADARRVRASLG
jgi:hypothetical protein